MQVFKFNKLMFSLFSKSRGRVGPCNIYIGDNEIPSSMALKSRNFLGGYSKIELCNCIVFL